MKRRMRPLPSGTYRFAIFVLFCFAPITIGAVYGQTITGTVTDATDSYALPGANIIALDASDVMIGGGVTDSEGVFRISLSEAGTYTVVARFVGYQESKLIVTVATGATVTANFVLTQTGFELNTVVVAASRSQEKALDAPASVSVLNAAEVANNAGTSSVEALRTTTGVDMSQTGIDRREVVLRGFNNAFSGASYVLTDYRQSAIPSLAVNIYSIMPAMNVDVDRIEVVRGPGSALYGPGVDQGVIHFITKDPFLHPGTTISISGGQQQYLGLQFRQAGTFGSSKNFGYKITGMYAQAEDWKLDPANKQDSLQIAADGEMREPDYNKLNVNGSLEYRFGSNGSLVANAGHATLTSTVLSGIGTLQANDFGYSYAQLRLRLGSFFAQVYANKNDAGDSYVYGQDADGDGINDIVVDKGIAYNAQGQYNLATWNGRQKFIFGADMELTRPNTEGTILGRNERDASGNVLSNADIDEYGAYAQSTTNITTKFALTLAARADYNNLIDEVTISPRAALVFKPVIGHSVRVTYNRAFSSPTTNSNFLDIKAGSIPGTDIIVRGRGSGTGFTFERNDALTDLYGSNLIASSINPAALGAPQGVGLALDATYGAVYQAVAAIPTAQLTAMLNAAGFPVNDGQTRFLVDQLDPTETVVTGVTKGTLGVLNLSDFTFKGVNDAVNVAPLKPSVTSTFEVGYKGVVSNKFLFAVDVYYSERKDFVGPLLVESPMVFVGDLAADLTAALSAGIEDNLILSGALAGLGTNPATVAATLVGLAAQTGQLPTASTPVAIVQPKENNPGVGVTPELMLSYRNFGVVDFYGVDASFEFISGTGLTVFGNMSVVSDSLFDEKELDEEGTGLSLALNAPTLKFRLGGGYELKNGLAFHIAGRYSNSFPVSSGPYQGTVPEFFLLDLGVGYDFSRYAPGVRADLSIANALDELHREFVGAPRLGRMAILKLTYTRR